LDLSDIIEIPGLDLEVFDPANNESGDLGQAPGKDFTYAIKFSFDDAVKMEYVLNAFGLDNNKTEVNGDVLYNHVVKHLNDKN
jgi:hypothetical protein